MFRSSVPFAAPVRRVTFCAAGKLVVPTGAMPVSTTPILRPFSQERSLRQGRGPAAETVSDSTLSPADRVHEASHVVLG
jgi:hypothetical protein